MKDLIRIPTDQEREQTPHGPVVATYLGHKIMYRYSYRCPALGVWGAATDEACVRHMKKVIKSRKELVDELQECASGPTKES